MGETITAGALEFYAEDRKGERDGGPSLQVWGTVDGTRVQIFRFDMFRKAPHYHYAPTGDDQRYNLDPLALDDGIGWVVSLLNRKLSPMLAKAGYESLATPDNVRNATAALPEVERKWRAVT